MNSLLPILVGNALGAAWLLENCGGGHSRGIFFAGMANRNDSQVAVSGAQRTQHARSALQVEIYDRQMDGNANLVNESRRLPGVRRRYGAISSFGEKLAEPQEEADVLFYNQRSVIAKRAGHAVPRKTVEKDPRAFTPAVRNSCCSILSASVLLSRRTMRPRTMSFIAHTFCRSRGQSNANSTVPFSPATSAAS